MALQKINIGTTPNDDTGDSLRAMAIKINAAIDELNAKSSTPSSVITSAQTLVVGTNAVNTVASAFTCNMPASPLSGDVVRVIDAGFALSTHNLTLSGNGKKIQNANSYAISGKAAFVYIDSVVGWVLF